MELPLVLGFLGALLIGITLGMIGGGGSILTVPVLVYILEMDPVKATGYSLFIVGATSLYGAFRYWRMGSIDIRTALIFAAPSMLAVFLTRYYLIPAIPSTLFEGGMVEMDKGIFLMTLFALLMMGTSWSMIREGNKKEPPSDDAPVKKKIPLILLEGIVVGALTGLVGAGGGFLIVPALVLVSRLPMKLAVGTSLLVIAIKSLIGFLGEFGHAVEIEFGFLLAFSGTAVLGAFLGVYWCRFIRGDRLKPIFGVFVLLMAIGILLAEWTGLSAI